ncbi:MAG: hypothetical protein H6656_10170 [Ardenticatenaceae bacterium]|nr:hypothetical protein [Ardenticatenaceae bacterium]
MATTASRYDQPLSYAITCQRLRRADCIVAQVWQADEERPHVYRKLDRLMVHPVWGWFFLAAGAFGTVLFCGQFRRGRDGRLVESVFFGEWINPLAVRAADVLPWPLLRDFLVGEYGLVTMALSYSIAIVLPIVFTFFLAFSLLEDSGYLARLAVMANRPFKAMGLNGKAVLPMVLCLAVTRWQPHHPHFGNAQRAAPGDAAAGPGRALLGPTGRADGHGGHFVWFLRTALAEAWCC